MSLLNSSLQAMDIERNHSYTFTINRAKGPGYDTVSDAKLRSHLIQILILRLW